MLDEQIVFQPAKLLDIGHKSAYPNSMARRQRSGSPDLPADKIIS